MALGAGVDRDLVRIPNQGGLYLYEPVPDRIGWLPGWTSTDLNVVA